MAETIEHIPEWMPAELKEMILRQVIVKNVRERLAMGWGENLSTIKFLRGSIESDWEDIPLSGEEWRKTLPPLDCEFCGKREGRYGTKEKRCRGGCGPPLVCRFCEMEMEKCECDGWWRCGACGKGFDECDC